MCQCVSAQTRIAVVSDIHVMAPDLLPEAAKSQSAWTTYYAGQRKMLEQSAGLFDKFVTTLTGMDEAERQSCIKKYHLSKENKATKNKRNLL